MNCSHGIPIEQHCQRCLDDGLARVNIERQSIEEAAAGGFSGTLAEWPYLQEALIHRGHPLPLGATADDVVPLCRELIREDREG